MLEKLDRNRVKGKIRPAENAGIFGGENCYGSELKEEGENMENINHEDAPRITKGRISPSLVRL